MISSQFDSKEEYIAYREEWKADYAELSQNIRDQKQIIRDQHCPSSDDYYTLRSMKEQATARIEERKASKIRAQEQYLAAKAITA